MSAVPGTSQDSERLRRKLGGRRIVFLLASFDLGGAERQAILFAQYLKESLGAHPAVWGFAPNLQEARAGRAWRLAEQYGVATRAVPASWGGRWTRMFRLTRFVALLRATRPHLLLPYTTLPNVLCGLTWQLGGARGCIWNQRDEGLAWPFSWGRRAAAQTPAFISNTRRGARFLVDDVGVDPQKVHVVPNALNPGSPRESRGVWRQRLGLADDQLAALCVANLQPFKDHLTLVRAWRIMLDALDSSNHRRFPVLLLAGYHGATFPAVRQLVDQLQLQENVRFLGAVEDVAGLNAASDISVLSSPSEGLPNALLEAMAAGLPVAGTDIPGIREALGIPLNEVAMTLSPVGNAQEMANRLLLLVQNNELRSRLGKENRERTATVHAPGIVFPAMANVLVRTLGSAKSFL